MMGVSLNSLSPEDEMMYNYIATQLGFVSEGLPQLIIQISLAIMHVSELNWAFMISLIFSILYNLPMFINNLIKFYY